MASQKEKNRSYSKLAQIYNSFNQEFPRERLIKNALQKEGDINFKIPSNGSISSSQPNLIGCTALHIAAMKNDVEISKMLLTNGADFTAQNQEGRTILHYLIDQSNPPFDLIRTILSMHLVLEDPSNPCDKDGFSHFHIACLLNRADVVEFFLDCGIPIDLTVNSDAKKYAGHTPLHFAAEGRALTVIPVLLKYKAEINVKDSRGLTPINIFLEKKIRTMEYCNTRGEKLPNRTIAKIDHIMNLLLIDNEVDEIGLTQFHIACTHLQDLSIAENFLEQKNVVNIDLPVNMNSPIRPGYTALHFAVHCNLDIAKMLLRKNANYLAKDANGVTPMDLIWEKCNQKDLCLLLRQNWNNIVFCDEQTDLFEFIKFAGETDHINSYLVSVNDIMTRIGEAGPSCWKGRTLLHFAVMLCNKSSEIIQACMNQGLNLLVDAQDTYGSTPIHLAFRMNKIDVVKILMEHCAGDNIADEDELSYLHIACALQNYNRVERFCRDRNNKAAYFGRTTYGWITRGSTALHVAMASGNSQIIEELLNCGLHLEAIDANGRTPLHRFLRLTDNVVGSVCRTLLLCPALTDRMLEDIGVTRLHLAIYVKDCDIGEFINRNNIEAVVKCQDSSSFLFPYDGFTPLHMAIKIGAKDEVVVCLLERGANLLAKNRQGDTPLYSALSQNPNCQAMNEIVTRLQDDDELRERMEGDSGITMLHIACYLVNKNAVCWLLIGHVDVSARVKLNCPVWAGCTPLHVLMKAMEYKEVNADFHCILGKILKAGVEVADVNGNGETPIHLALREFSNQSSQVYRVIEQLINKLEVYDVNPVDQHGLSHFHAACLVNNAGVVKLFLENGVDVNQPIDFCAKNFSGETPLHMAVDYRTDKLSNPESKRETIQLLLTNGADVTAEGSFGQTPFHKVVRLSVDVDVLEQFVEFGAILNAKDLYEQTPLELLLQSENVSAEKIKLFEKYGCRLHGSNPLTEQGFMSMLISQTYHQNYMRIARGVASTESGFVAQCIQIMLDAVDSSVPDDHGRNMIHNIVTTNDPFWEIINHDDLIKQFQSGGIDIDLQDEKGKTALHLAAQFGNYTAVNVLLDNGADVNVLDATNKTALSYAMDYHNNDQYCPAKHCHAQVIERLVAHLGKLDNLKLKINRNNIFEKQRAFRFIINRFFAYQHNTNVTALVDNAKTLLVVEQPKLYLKDFLSETGKGLIIYPFTFDASREIIDKFFLEYNGDSKDICALQYRKVVKRLALAKTAVNSMCKLAETNVPIVCVEMIFQYLTNYDLQNFIEAVDDDVMIID